MKTALKVFTVLVFVVVGCEPTATQDAPLLEGKELLTVDFQQGKTLRYKFTSSRDISINWEPTKKASKSRNDTTHRSSESSEMVIAYTPIEVDPYGLTIVEATCESVKVGRSKGMQKDALETLKGKSFTLSVGPTGAIVDYSQLEKLMKETGDNAFRPKTNRGNIKEPDMVCDFVANQWFLWDSISSIEKAAEGVSVGQTWKSVLPVTGPMVMRRARDVTYTLAKIQETEKGRLAVIRSSYEKAELIPQPWPPLPYTSAFRVSGTFGFLRGYNILELKGKGEELFNIDAGRIEKYDQQYRVLFSASLPMGMGVNPQITIKQNLKMQLLK